MVFSSHSSSTTTFLSGGNSLFFSCGPKSEPGKIAAQQEGNLWDPPLSTYHKTPAKMSGQSPPDGPAYPHFAMIYIDREGNLCQRSSESIADSRQSILSPRVTGEFLRAVARSRESQGPHYQVPTPAQSSQGPQFNEYSSVSSQRDLTVQSVKHLDSEQSVGIPTEAGPPLQPAMWPPPSESWPGRQEQVTCSQPRKKNFGGRSLNLTSHQSASISVREPDILRLYYEKIFQNLQQTNCRVIAKAYIKLVEPRKQVNYPYNGRKTVDGRVQQLDPEATKPPWWPIGVCHREPDHLPKVERIRLLVHILCELRASHGITAARLKECDQPIRRQILPVDRLQILDEAYRVREEEEKFEDGISDGEQIVMISRSNLPQIAEEMSSGQSSPTGPVSTQATKSEASDDTPRIDRSQVIASAEDLQPVAPYYPPNPFTPTIHPTMQTSPSVQYQPINSSPHNSASPQELKRKRELSSGTNLVDRTRPIGMAHYPYPGTSNVQPHMDLYNQQAQQAHQAQQIPQVQQVPQVQHGVSQDTTAPITQHELPTEPMLPYGYPYYYNY